MRKKFAGIKKNTYLCIDEPIHVHIVGHDGAARFELVEDKFVLIESDHIKVSDLNRLQKSVNENADIIIDRWHEYFDGK